jgi:hypothetical protein
VPDRFAQLAERLGAQSRDRALERQVQIWLSEIGLDDARDARDRYEAAGADTIIFVLDEEREPTTIGRLAGVLGEG